MGKKVLSLSDYRGQPPERRPRRAPERARRRSATRQEPATTVIVEQLPPDMLLITMPRTLWPSLSDWLVSQGVCLTGGR